MYKLKTCRICKKKKPLDKFYPRRDFRHGRVYESRRTECGDCLYTKYESSRKKWYLNRKEKLGFGAGTIRIYGLKNAQKIYQSLGRKCFKCGTESNLTIHHKDGNGIGNYNIGLPMNNDLINLEILCRSCHAKKHASRPRGKYKNEVIKYAGEKKTLSEWSKIYHLNPNKVRMRYRVYEWDIHKTLTTP